MEKMPCYGCARETTSNDYDVENFLWEGFRGAVMAERVRRDEPGGLCGIGEG